jgi:hypothetical protein
MSTDESITAVSSEETTEIPVSEAEPKKADINILKVRDDHEPLEFVADGDKFKLQTDLKPSWLSSEEFGQKELRNRIEPWLTSLFQSEHLSLLAGSGLTHAVHYLAAKKSAAGMGALTLSNYMGEINQAAKRAAKEAWRKRVSASAPSTG